MSKHISAKLDSILQALQMLDKQPRLPLRVKDRLLNFHLDLKFLKLFSRFLIKSGGDQANSSFENISIETLLEEDEKADEEWQDLASDLLQNFWRLEAVFGYGSFEQLLDHLIHQIRDLEEKLCFIKDLFYFSERKCSDQQKLKEFWSFMQGVMNYAACLSFLYWIDKKDENQAGTLVKKLYIAQLFPSKSSLSKNFEVSELVMSLYDWLLDDLVIPVRDRFEVFQEGLVFLATFLINPPEKPEREAGGVLLRRMVDIISDVASSICAIYMVDTEMNNSPENEKILLRLQVEIDRLMAEIREIYVHFPDFACSHFPVTGGTGFFDCLLGNLEEILKSKASCVPFAMDKIMSIKEDLLSTRSFLKDVMEQKNVDQEVFDLRKQMIYVAYNAKHVVDSCFIVGTPIWYDMLCLSQVTAELKVIKAEIKKITDLEIHVVRKADEEYHYGPLLPRQVDTSQINEIVVGFKDEIQTIIDRVTRGTTQLDIISIVGMPGQGKTTLARKVYNDPSVKYHFHKCAWCCVSQVYQTKEVLLKILSDVSIHDRGTSSSEVCEDELADKLWKSLKGRRFVIVMDDIWDIGAWDGIRRVLPDDGIGSRVVFTSRIHNLVLQAEPNCNPHPIRLLNDDESWELLQMRLFSDDGCLSEMREIGKKIASKCKGLPLAIVLVAGILARKEKSFDCWREMIGTMDSHIATGGCMDLVELSYKQLPDHLRPCFLYFGALGEDNIIRVQKLKQMWTAEGFVPRNNGKKLADTAGEYLMNLIDQSLVTVAARSSKGEIKACYVHDVLYDFCLAKAREEGFLHKFHARDVSDDSPKIYEQYRLSIDNICKWEQFINSRPAGDYVHSLVVSGNDEIWSKTSSHKLFLLGFKFLHVLDMECIFTHTFPEETTLMVQLRYLAICCGSLYLSSSIANLWNLETLIVKRGCRFTKPSTLPDAFWTLKSLRHIKIANPVRMTFKDYHTDESCQLHNVVTFSMPMLTSGKDITELSRRLPRLQKLKFVLELKDPCFQFPALTCFRELESLAVYNRNVYHQSPNFDFPSTLKKLTLTEVCLTRDAISAIGKLLNLQVLKLRYSYFFDQRWDLEDGEFLNLKFLELSNVKLQHWNDCSEPFPYLERLILNYCDNLEEIPPLFGSISTLKRIEVKSSCLKASSSAKRIVEEQREMGNDIELYTYETPDYLNSCHLCV